MEQASRSTRLPNEARPSIVIPKLNDKVVRVQPVWRRDHEKLWTLWPEDFASEREARLAMIHMTGVPAGEKPAVPGKPGYVVRFIAVTTEVIAEVYPVKTEGE